MHIAAIAGVVLGAILALYIARIIRAWMALRDLLKLPNVVQIRRVKRSRGLKSASRFDSAV
jgi:hypothetical protein